MKTADLFDLDHTLIKKNCSFHFGLYLYRKGYFSKLHFALLGAVYFFHKIGFFSLSDVHHSCFKRLFKGHSKAVFDEQVSLFLDDHFESLLFSPALERLKLAQKKGHLVAILSSSPDFLVEPIAKRLGVPHHLASIYAVDQNQNFSHISLLVQGKEKGAWVNKWVKSRRIERDKTTAYTDSILDLSFLNAVGIRIAVNPDKKLRSLCQQKGWEIL